MTRTGELFCYGRSYALLSAVEKPVTDPVSLLNNGPERYDGDD